MATLIKDKRLYEKSEEAETVWRVKGKRKFKEF